MDHKQIDLTVSIVNTDNRDQTLDCLRSIYQGTDSTAFEVYVVDNACSDGSSEAIEERFPQVKLIRNSHRLGFSANHNQVIRVGRGHYLLILNDDMIVLPGAFEKMVRFMELHSEVGAVGCKLLNPDGTLQRSCWRGYPSILESTIRAFYLWKFFPKASFIRRTYLPLEELTGVTEVDQLLGACIMVRREVLDTVGYLDERFYMTREDTDWCQRIKAAGWKIYWVPDGEIIHLGEQTTFREPERYLPELNRSYCNYYRKYNGHSWKVILLKVVLAGGALVGMALWSARALFRERGAYGWRMVKGHWQVLKALPWL